MHEPYDTVATPRTIYLRKQFIRILAQGSIMAHEWNEHGRHESDSTEINTHAIRENARLGTDQRTYVSQRSMHTHAVVYQDLHTCVWLVWKRTRRPRPGQFIHSSLDIITHTLPFNILTGTQNSKHVIATVKIRERRRRRTRKTNSDCASDNDVFHSMFKFEHCINEVSLTGP